MSIELPQGAGATLERRDAQGRLIGISRREGAPALAGPRLLVAIDGSPTSLRVVDTLLQWRHAHGWAYEAHIANVQMFLSKEAAEQHLVATADEDTRASRAALAAGGIGFVFHVAMGPPADRLLELADDLGAGHIVMGTRGHDALGGLLLGSVAYKIVHRAAVPVTLVR